MSNIEYKPEYDHLIETALKETMDLSVSNVQRIEKGEYNSVYKFEANNKKKVLRIFRRADYPSISDLNWINAKLRDKNIEHAEIFYSTHDSTHFPGGFMVSEYKEGENSEDLIKSSRMSYADYAKKLGLVLREVHEIKCESFGNLNEGRGADHHDFAELNIEETKTRFLSLNEETRLSHEVKDKIIRSIESLRKFENYFKPVLVHSDCGPDNSLIDDSGKLILLDWDNATSSIWLTDLADFTYWRNHYAGETDNLIEAFMSTYTQTDLNQNDINEILRSLHIIKAIKLLPYYRDTQKRSESYEHTMTKLFWLL